MRALDKNKGIKRHLFASERFPLYILAVEMVMVMVMVMAMAMSTPEYVSRKLEPDTDLNSSCRDVHLVSTSILSTYMYVSVAVRGIIGLVLLLRSRIVVDSIGLKREIYLCLGISIVVPPSRVPIMYLINDESWNGTIHLGVVILNLILFHMVIVALPLLDAISNTTHRPNSTLGTPSSGVLNDINGLEKSVLIEHFLLSKDGANMFGKFLASELALENLDFWQDAVSFFFCFGDGNGDGSMECWKAALPIYRRYIANGCDMPINLPSRISKHLQNLFEMKRHTNESIAAFTPVDFRRRISSKFQEFSLKSTASKNDQNTIMIDDDDDNDVPPEILQRVNGKVFEEARISIAVIFVCDNEFA